MRQVNLSALTQGIQRLREKGSPDPQSLYDLVNGYVAIDGSVRQRPGTELVAVLPAGTHGLVAHRGELVVFSIAPKTMPAGFRCEVVTHPDSPTTDIKRVWFAAPFLGFMYSAVEFVDGKVFHYWLQDGNTWKADTMYREGTIVVPTTPNGLGYKATRLSAPNPAWAPDVARAVADKVEPTKANGYYYEVTNTGGDSPRSGKAEPTWPVKDGEVVVEWADTAPTTTPTTGGDTGTGGGTDWDDRYCVAADSFLDDDTLASEAKPGDLHTTWKPETGFVRTRLVAVGKPILQPCVRITLSDGSSLRCSVTTPFTDPDAMRDGEGWLAPDMLGKRAFNGDGEAMEVVRVEDVGEQLVIPLDFGGRSFPAGDFGMVYSHNMRKAYDSTVIR